MPSPAKPYVLTPPLTAEQVENLDQMLQELYDRLAQLESLTLASPQQTMRTIRGR